MRRRIITVRALRLASLLVGAGASAGGGGLVLWPWYVREDLKRQKKKQGSALRSLREAFHTCPDTTLASGFRSRGDLFRRPLRPKAGEGVVCSREGAMAHV